MKKTSRHNVLSACLSALVAFAAVAGGAGCNAPQNDPSHGDHPSASGDTRRNDWEKRNDDPAIKAETYFAAGQLAESQDAYERAATQYDKALKLSPNHAGAIFRLGVLYARFHKYPAAIAKWQQYVQVTGGDATGYGNLGFCYELAGRPDEAEAAYKKGVGRDPANAACRVNYGLMLARHGRFNEATLHLQVVLSEAEVHYNLGSAYEGLGRRDLAKVEYRKAIGADPKLREAQARLEGLN